MSSVARRYYERGCSALEANDLESAQEALRAALAQKLRDGHVIVIDALSVSEIKTRAAVDMLKRLGIDGKALLVDVKPEDKLALSVRNIEGVRVLPSNRVSARDIMNTRRVVLTQAALEKLQEALG